MNIPDKGITNNRYDLQPYDHGIVGVKNSYSVVAGTCASIYPDFIVGIAAAVAVSLFVATVSVH